MNAARGILALLTSLSSLGFAAHSWAVAPGGTVPDFRLVDHRGQPHRLYDLSQQKAVVVMIQGNGCPIVRQALPALQQIRDQYQAKGVEFLLLNSNLQDTTASIAKEAEEFSIAFPILVDQKQKTGEALGVDRTSEVFVIEPRTWKLLYRGPMDDRLHYERQRPPTHKYLIDALDAVLAGKPVQVTSADGVGCIVNFPERTKRQKQRKDS
jgi:peroxiredoxin